MRLDLSQHLRLQQRMKLSPRIIQAMEILQLPLLALQERIEEELASNPCLETRDSAADGAAPAKQEDQPANAGEKDLVVKDDSDHQEDFERLADFGEEYAEDLDWTDRPSRRRATSGERDSKLDALANTPAREQSLNEYLLQQWAFVEASGQVQAAGEVIISNIDADGYLRTPLEELVREGDRPITPASLKAALALVWKLDPPGVGARDLRECLLLQLDAEAAAEDADGTPGDGARRLEDPALARELVSNYLREIELNHIPQIAKRTGRSVQQIKTAIAGLARLDPHPGRLYGQRSVPYIIPDAIIDLDEQGNVVVTMLDGHAPALRISRTYLKMARSGKIDPKAKEFIRRNLRAAKWLIGAISQRRTTVRRVVEEVFKAQKDFLERGPDGLRPLPMMDIASKVSVHVATISRAVAGKYVQTPRGIFALRMFFSGGTTTASGEHVAWDAVKARLKEIVDHEDKFNPLADDQIAEALREAGIKIARRTVAKYRNLLNIASARQRRQY